MVDNTAEVDKFELMSGLAGWPGPACDLYSQRW